MSQSATGQNKRRVLVLAENPYFGGINTHILALLESFRDRPDFELVPACLGGLNADRTLVKTAADRGFDVTCVPLRFRFDWRLPGAVRALVRDCRADLVHVHGYRAGIVASRAVKDRPIVMTSHGVAVGAAIRTRLWQWIVLRQMRKMAGVVAVSEHVAGWLVANGIPAQKIHVVHNGILIPELDGASPRSTLGISDDAYIILFCGRLVEGKGIPSLLQAAQRIANAVVIFVGDGALRSQAERLADKLRVEARFVGQVNEPWPYYKMADVLALPADMEAFPTVLIEAAAHRLPAVATSVGGIPEIIQDGATGLLVPPKDPEALSAALTKLQDPALRESFGGAARRRYEEAFTPERMADKIAGVYAAALSGSRETPK